MAVKTGFLYDENFRPIIRGGKFAIGATTQQEAAAIIKSNKTNWKHDGLCGCDLNYKIKGEPGKIRKSVELQMERDGKTVTSLRILDNAGAFDVKVEEN